MVTNDQRAALPPFAPGDIIPYLEMCAAEGASLQRGMNFKRHRESVILMSLRPNAPYRDQVLDDGQTLIYEGHDILRLKNGPDPKTMDQPQWNPGGSPTQNGMFYAAAQQAKPGHKPKIVRVYEIIKPGIWAYAGRFELVDAWTERSEGREVFKFKLHLTDAQDARTPAPDLDHTRLIPTAVKVAVWSRDQGRCVLCQSSDNLHYDHVIPFSKGGSSLVKENIQLLCARHNLSKSDRIE